MFDISDVKVVLVDPRGDSRLRAYASMTLNRCLAINEMRIIQGEHRMFVSMPDKPAKEYCPHCSHRNGCQARFCNSCGAVLPLIVPEFKYHDLIAPLTQACRDLIEGAVIGEYSRMISEQPYEEGVPGTWVGERTV